LQYLQMGMLAAPSGVGSRGGTRMLGHEWEPAQAVCIDVRFGRHQGNVAVTSVHYRTDDPSLTTKTEDRLMRETYEEGRRAPVKHPPATGA
jgi:hypothetical protein